MLVLETKNLTKKYKDTLAVDNVNITVEKGDIYALIGDNGAGKSTFLKMICNLVFPTSGEIFLFEKEYKQNVNDCLKKMGALIEHPALINNMTVEKLLQYYAYQKGVVEFNCDEILEITNILHKKKTKCKKLSMGQRQRVSLAISLLSDPEFIIFDEPINGLDPDGIIKFRNLILKLNRQRNTTFLISSHILSELEKIATKFAFLDNGLLIEEIKEDDLRKKLHKYISIKVENVELFSSLIDKEFPEVLYKVYPDNQIRIFDKVETKSLIELSNKYETSILEVKKVDSDLENYFMNLKRGAKNA
ncbi:MAG: ATP-binding cassette domain-containing protein [Tissierellia bacterium]|nr:ATP-binding cassette domain-containing protein [Tissierellia bacterium]